MTGRTRLWDSDWNELRAIPLAANPFLPALPWISWVDTPATWLESRTTEIIREEFNRPAARCDRPVAATAKSGPVWVVTAEFLVGEAELSRAIRGGNRPSWWDTFQGLE